jgi:hypothetical protein
VTQQTADSGGRVEAAKAVCTADLILAPTHTMPGFVRLTVRRGRKVRDTDYQLSRVPSAFGRGFKLVKLLGEHDVHFVNLDGARSSCECLGFLRHGRCKHVKGLADLVAEGKL